jgi:hypothetical protein
MKSGFAPQALIEIRETYWFCNSAEGQEWPQWQMSCRSKLVLCRRIVNRSNWPELLSINFEVSSAIICSFLLSSSIRIYSFAREGAGSPYPVVLFSE